MSALSPPMARALALLDRGGFIRSAAGWHPADNSVGAFSTLTIKALVVRGFARWRFKSAPGRLNRPVAAYVTEAGRAALPKLKRAA